MNSGSPSGRPSGLSAGAGHLASSPAGGPGPLPRTAQDEALGEFPDTAFLKFLLSDPGVQQRPMASELPTELLADLHRLLGGTPRFLDQVRIRPPEGCFS